MSDDISKPMLGQNLFELVEFTLERHLGDGTVVQGIYGVGVDKVREVIKMPKINKLSTKLKGVEGVFELRGVPIPAINLGIILGDQYAPVKNSDQIVIAEFNLKRAGFIVNSTQRIKRISMDDIMPPAADAGSCIGGMSLMGQDDFLFILDIEKVIEKIEQASLAQLSNFKESTVTDSVIDFHSSNAVLSKQSNRLLVLIADTFHSPAQNPLDLSQSIKSFG